MLTASLFSIIHLPLVICSLVSALRVCDQFKTPPLGTSAETLTAWEVHDQQLLDYISSVIPEALAHTGSTAFDHHLQGVQLILRHWNASSALCDAGLFHSIYGTEGFQGFKLSLAHRKTIQELIGKEAERLVWIFCMLDRYSLDQSLYVLDDISQSQRRFELLSRPELGRFPIVLRDEEEWLDFIELTLADWLEQVEGAAEKKNPLFEWEKGEAWSYRRLAYAKMADILAERRGLTIARETLNAIYAMEPEVTRHLHQEITPPMSQAAREAREALTYRDQSCE